MPSKVSKTITISRTKWRRGKQSKATGFDITFLYNPSEETTHNMCCLGQYLNQCGVPKYQLEYNEGPGDVSPDIKVTGAISLLLEEGRWSTSVLAEKAISINDSEKITDKEREKQLKALFKPHGIKLVFVK